ncbi:hypothetical protein [Acidiphilium sp. JA12-A1]|uniref:hypothetical protein n=1 Tax=Acidiphilium sp. JA12-A1 TaxID=1464546 RepID=UPI0004613FC3|nr:hypothetical protein [Acidiphilium sp. JA12-A1]KDM68187.1 hypothetical protein ACIDI_14c00100 [Acidiphilium sp. JA12-A1]
MKKIDVAYEIFLKIVDFIKSNEDNIVNESETRFKVLDRILIEVLGWKQEDISVEPKTSSGYIDYLLSSGGRHVFVIEAKRKDYDLFSTKIPGFCYYKVGGPALSVAKEGIEQAARYCFENAIPYAALTNGLSWIGFRAVRTDGIVYRDGLAAAFPNFDSIKDRFAEFYDLFSYEGVRSKLYNIYLNREEGGVLTGSEELVSLVPPHPSPHFVVGMKLPNMPLLRSISVNRRIRGNSRCFGMFGINS